MSERAKLSSSGMAKFYRYHVFFGCGLLFILILLFAVGDETQLLICLPFLAVPAVAVPAFVRWRYTSPVFLAPSGVETDDESISWSAIREIQFPNWSIGRCFIRYDRDAQAKRIDLLVSSSDSVPSSVLTHWQKAVGRDAVEKRWSLFRGHVLCRVR